MTNSPRPERIEYGERSLDADQLGDDPIKAFGDWFAEAVEAGIPEANAMCLCTSGKGGSPDGRIVLLKTFDSRGFLFYTNYESEKARHLSESPQGALVFWWQSQRRQIRIRGVVEKVPAGESDEYFATRPEDSRMGAWASLQSEEVESRQALLARLEEVRERFESVDVPRPLNWGGYVLRPSEMEFWQGRDSRLHDRIKFRRRGDVWEASRLMP